MRLFFTIFFCSCVSLPTSQTPQVVAKDKFGYGLSLSSSWLIKSDTVLFVPLTFPPVQVRYGIIDRSDFGFTFFGPPLFGLTYVDYKYQFLNSRILGAFIIGTGLWSLQDISLISPFLGISIGNEHLYLGSRIHYHYFSYVELSLIPTPAETVTFRNLLITPFGALTPTTNNFKFIIEVNLGIPIKIKQNNFPLIYSQKSILPTFFYGYSLGFIHLPTKKKRLRKY